MEEVEEIPSSRRRLSVIIEVSESEEGEEEAEDVEQTADSATVEDSRNSDDDDDDDRVDLSCVRLSPSVRLELAPVD